MPVNSARTEQTFCGSSGASVRESWGRLSAHRARTRQHVPCPQYNPVGAVPAGQQISIAYRRARDAAPRLLDVSGQRRTMEQINPTEQELQMIEVIREAKNGFRLVVEQQDDSWDITLTAALKTLSGEGKVCRARGTGSSFERAWDDVTNVQF
jgi:hypothetical protein